MPPEARPMLERRSLDQTVRALDDQAPNGETIPRRVAGIACLFDTDTEIAPGLFERIEPGAFRTLGHPEARDVKLLLSHQGGLPLASHRNKTLHLRADPAGLRFGAQLPDTATGRDTWESVKRGDLSGASIGFRVRPDGARWETRDGRPLRIVSDVELFEVSLTAMPAQVGAVVEARALDEGLRRLDAIQRAERDRIARANLAGPRQRQQLAEAWAALAEAMSTDRDWRPRYTGRD
jgi:uncharacterized protein